MEFVMSCRPKEKYVHISMKKDFRNFDGQSKSLNLWSYVVILNLVGRK